MKTKVFSDGFNEVKEVPATEYLKALFREHHMIGFKR